ncbi:hypothetical protein Vi05172_g8181 [Venturia inaequalis]|nr:hypothetical protein Vi05172_g8181 [Venturia inaequalis]
MRAGHGRGQRGMRMGMGQPHRPIRVRDPRAGHRQQDLPTDEGNGQEFGERGRQDGHFEEQGQGNRGFEENWGGEGHRRDFIGEQPDREPPMAFGRNDGGEEGEGDIADIDMADVLARDGGQARGGDVGGTLGARRN